MDRREVLLRSRCAHLAASHPHRPCVGCSRSCWSPAVTGREQLAGSAGQSWGHPVHCSQHQGRPRGRTWLVTMARVKWPTLGYSWLGFGYTRLGPWLNQCLGRLPTAHRCLMKPVGLEVPPPHVPCPGGGCWESWEEWQDWVRTLPILSPSAFQLCVEFIKDTLSVEQVCEALQVSVTQGGQTGLKITWLILGQEQTW